MDPNHVPSSPFQHHRRSSTRTENPSQERPTPELNCTSNCSTAYQPSADASPVASTTLPQWQAQDVSSYGERGYVDVEVDQWPAGPSSQPWDGALTQPLASSSRCPSPVPAPSPEPTSSTLLTSEPLNRSSSGTHTSFTRSPLRRPQPLPSRLGKRGRSTSLPPVTPDLKRSKHRHGHAHIPTPSEPWNWTIREPKRERSKLERAEQQAVLLRQELELSRPRHATSVIVASRGPPINVNTLKSLDANEILRNPQLRHDLLFDALAFRPVSLSPVAPVQDGTLPAADPATDAHASAAVANMYWESIADEIFSGCRCARWRVTGAEGRIDAASLVAKKKESGCVCGGWRLDMTESQWWTMQESRWQSRLPELIKTLREILVSLMGSTTPCASHFAHSFSREALAAHEATCPTVTHALVPELYSALDPEFITVQVRRKVFSYSLFNILGEAMKVHCAPVRDALVNDMVETAFRGDIPGSLRKCFDCVEIMKLDIANHQVHALRPFLWKAAASHEFSAFRNHLASFEISLLQSSTCHWIRDASLRVIKDLDPSRRSKLLSSRSELVTRSVAEGFLSLVCGDWVHATWPPVCQRRLSGTAGIQLADMSPLPTIDIPESFKMDTRRIKNFHAEFVDIAIAHHVTGAFKTYLATFHPNLSKSSIRQYLFETRRDIENTMDTVGSLRGSDLASRMAARLVRPDATFGDVPRVVPHEEARVVEVMTPVFEQLVTALSLPTSPSYIAAQEQVRRAITMVLAHRLLKRTNSMPTRPDQEEDEDLDEMMESSSFSPPTPNRPRPSRPVITLPSSIRQRMEENVEKFVEMEDEFMESCGMLAVKEEVRSLAEKMSPIVAFNLKVFMDTYKEKGMVVGA